MTLGKRVDGQRGTDEPHEKQVAHAQTEYVDADAADTLLGPEGDAHESGDEAHDGADSDADEDPEQVAARLEGDVIAAESAHQHDAVDAEVQHPAALAQGLAQGGQQEGCGVLDGGGDGRRQDGVGEEGAHGRALASLMSSERPVPPATSCLACPRRWASSWIRNRTRR